MEWFSNSSVGVVVVVVVVVGRTLRLNRLLSSWLLAFVIVGLQGSGWVSYIRIGQQVKILPLNSPPAGAAENLPPILAEVG